MASDYFDFCLPDSTRQEGDFVLVSGYINHKKLISLIRRWKEYFSFCRKEVNTLWEGGR